MVFAVTLETVLSGHENWIYSVKWKPKSHNGKMGLEFSSSFGAERYNSDFINAVTPVKCQANLHMFGICIFCLHYVFLNSSA